MPWLILLVLLLLPALPAKGEEAYLLGGTLWENSEGRSASVWNAEYLHGLGEHIGIGYTYFNQGHLPGHHRDGETVNLWLRTNLLDRRLSLMAGVGPFFYYDTTYPANAEPSQDVHGWGAFFSVAATWYTDCRWLFRLRANWTEASGSFDAFALLAGLGYQLDAPEERGTRNYAPPYDGPELKNELTLLLGQTTVNIPGDAHSIGYAAEYRRSIWKYMDWSVGWLDEGRNGLIHRYGVNSQLWLTREFMEDHLSLALGGGAYFANDRKRDNKNEIIIPGIFTMTAAYRIVPNLQVRATWNRVITDYDRDSDVFLGGIGYRF